MVAARRGMAVLQNHQSDSRSSVSGRMWMRHFGFLRREEEEVEKRRGEGRRWGGRAGEYFVVASALLLLLVGEMESVVALAFALAVVMVVGLCCSYIYVVAASVPWVRHVDTNKHFGRAGRYEGTVAEGLVSPVRVSIN